MTPPSTAILIAAWNHLETTTRPCIESIRRFSGVPYRVICVNNASTDGTRAYLDSVARTDTRVAVVARETNLGWAGGILEGLRHLRADERFVCVLNSDVIVTPGWLSRLVAHLQARPELTLIIPNEKPDLCGPIRRAARRLAGRRERAHRPPEPKPPPRQMVPGTVEAPPPPGLDTIVRRAARVARRFRAESRPATPSGFCMLLARARVPLLVEYLEDFDRYRSGELDWREFWSSKQATCRVALDTCVFHARGGSGGYYFYDR